MTKGKPLAPEIPRETQQFLENIISTLREPFLILEGNLKVIFANQAFLTEFAVSEEETLGSPLPSLGNGQWNFPELLHLLQEIIPDKKELVDFGMQHTFEKIGRRSMILNAKLLNSGEKNYILLAIEDATAKVQLVDALKESEERFRRMFETAHDSLLLISKSGPIVDANLQAIAMFGYTKEEILGLKIWEIGLCENEENFPTIMKLLERQGFYHNDAQKLKHRNGEEFYVELLLVNRAKVIQCNIRDITERKIAEAALAHSMEVKSDFTSMVSHELRTPLTAMREALSVLIEGLLGNLSAEQLRCLFMVRSNLDRMTRLLTSVLNLQRLESGKLDYHTELNSFSEILAGISSTNLPLIHKRGLDLKVECSKDLPQALFDKDMIIQVIENLLFNAIKYSEKGDVITISAVQENHAIKVSVSDQGAGIAQEDLDKLFRKFSQTQKTTGGSGLGLYICKGIIEGHHGTIGVQSEKGKGSTFYFTIPLS